MVMIYDGGIFSEWFMRMIRYIIQYYEFDSTKKFLFFENSIIDLFKYN